MKISVFMMFRLNLILLTYFLCCYFIVHTREIEHCEKKEKYLAILDIAKEFVMKASDQYQIFADCENSSINLTDCKEKEKTLFYLQSTINLMTEVKDSIEKSRNVGTEEPETTQITKTTSLTTQSIATETTTAQPLVYSRDCSELFQNGQNVSGVYTIWPSSSLFPNRSLEVFCDMDTDGGGWTVVQRRGNFTPQENFYRVWNDYKFGFGNINKDFWLGNDNLFILSNQGKYAIRFDLKTVEEKTDFAFYKTFYIEDENSGYKLHIGDYSGTAGDSMGLIDGMGFSTRDKDNQRGCSEQRKGGWWYRHCSYSNLNGQYMPGMRDSKSIYWYEMKKYVGLAASEIKIKAIAQ